MGNRAPKRNVSLMPPLPEPVDAVGELAGLAPVGVVVLGWQATIQIVVTVASKARQSVEKNLLVMVTMNYDHVYKVAVIVSVKKYL